MKTPLRYEVWENPKYSVFCQYNFIRLGMRAEGMCHYKNGANTLKDAKEQMKSHYALMHGKDNS